MEGAEFEVRRRRELEAAMRRAAHLEAPPAAPLALLGSLKASQMKIFDLWLGAEGHLESYGDSSRHIVITSIRI